MYEHGIGLSKQSHEEFVRDWIGGAAEQRDCLFFAVNHNNADMLSYLLKEIKLGGCVNAKEDDL